LEGGGGCVGREGVGGGVGVWWERRGGWLWEERSGWVKRGIWEVVVVGGGGGGKGTGEKWGS